MAKDVGLPPGFVLDAPPAPVKQNSKAESLGKGVGMGASLGFMDEGLAAILPILRPDLYEGGYRQALGEARDVFSEAKADNPDYYTGGEIGGGVLTGIAPSGIPGMQVKGWGSAATSGGIFGGSMGAGYSENDPINDTLGFLKDVGIGTAGGAAGGEVGYGLSKAIGAGLSSPTVQRFLADESGAVGSAVPRTGGQNVMSRAEQTVYRNLMESGYTKEQAAELVKRAGRATDTGVPLSLPEAADNSTLLGYEKRVRQVPGLGNETEAAFTGARKSDGIPLAYQGMIEKNIAPIKSPDEAGQRISVAAKSVIDDAVKARSAKVAPMYAEISTKKIPENWLNGLLDKNPALKSAYNSVKGDVNFQQLLADTERQTGVAIPENSIGWMDALKKNLDGKIAGSMNMGQPTADTRALMSAKTQLVQAIDSLNPKYAKVRAEFAGESPAITKMQDTVVGVLSKLDDGNYAQAGKKLFSAPDSQIRYARNLIAQKDPEAWSGLIASHLNEVGEVANHSPVKMLSAMTNKESGNIIRMKKLNAALDSSQIAAKDRFFSDLERAAKIKFGSDTMTNAQIDISLAQEANPLQFSLENMPRNKTELMGRVAGWFSQKIQGGYYKDLADIFVGKNSDEFAKKILATKPGSYESYKAIYEGIAKAGTPAVRSATESMARPTPETPKPNGASVAKGAVLGLPAGFVLDAPPAQASTQDAGGAFPDEPRQPLRMEIHPQGSRQTEGELPPQSSLTPSDDFTAKNEGLSLASYKDTTGNRTVGYGFNMQSGIAPKVWKHAGIKTPFADVYRGKKEITEQEANQLKQASMQIATGDAIRLFPKIKDMNASQQMALIDLSYQYGMPKLQKHKGFINAVNKGDMRRALLFLDTMPSARISPERNERVKALLVSG